MLGSTGQGSTAGQALPHRPMTADTVGPGSAYCSTLRSNWVPSQVPASTGESPSLLPHSSLTGPRHHLSSISPGILMSDFPIFPPGTFLCQVWRDGWGNTASPPSLGILPSPRDLVLLCISALCLLSASSASQTVLWGLPRRVYAWQTCRKRQYPLLDQQRWFRMGDKLLGRRVLLGAHKQLLSSAVLLAS